MSTGVGVGVGLGVRVGVGASPVHLAILPLSLVPIAPSVPQRTLRAAHGHREAARAEQDDAQHDLYAMLVLVQGSDVVLYDVKQSASWPDTTLYNPWQGDKLGTC